MLGPGAKQTKFCAIIYGPSNKAAIVGTWLDQCSIYLQLPEKCDRHMRYSNPHCLSFSDETVVMTSELESVHTNTVTGHSDGGVDYYVELDFDESFAEATQPALISAPLHSYQKQGLTFMLQREQGWHFREFRRDVWRSYYDRHGITRLEMSLCFPLGSEAPGV
ncbi:uncharacterized protein A1O9_08291 [Exophiala aquamarina CBS 119918]|uniref:Uncharacterized protein n=1 Tax=Exophiala aquamarina CBS 119918 TaxID=1182545 RepID=A0A072P6P4_9EURO|nr:uncharacterized protein A1O9_08291 [Exophiala aquamarina CBS 119918]KEF55541.1 hypothetical protein A1O9_08291 [Exophiala aquamarina CBS 119918]